MVPPQAAVAPIQTSARSHAEISARAGFIRPRLCIPVSIRLIQPGILDFRFSHIKPDK